MAALKNNIKFCYRYRDYANYKKYNEVIFANPKNRTIEEMDKFINDHLFDDKLFYTTEWNLPDLHFDDWDPELDNFVHEFDSVSLTEDNPTMQYDTETFIEVIKNAVNGWML